MEAVHFGTGTTIARQAHAHLRHGGPFEACPRCNPVRWAPAEDQGALVTADDGRLVEHSALVARLLVSYPEAPTMSAVREAVSQIAAKAPRRPSLVDTCGRLSDDLIPISTSTLTPAVRSEGSKGKMARSVAQAAWK